MKQLMFFLVFFLNLFSLFATDYSFFKYATFSDGDYFTGQEYFGLAYFCPLKNERNIIQIKDNYIRNNEKYYQRSVYNENGQIVKWDTNYHDGDFIFFNYNKDNYLTVFGRGDFKFEYPKENQRNYYFKENFQYRQTIENKENIYTVIREQINSRTNSLYVDNVSTYIYNGKMIQNYQSTSYTQVQELYTIESFDFEYDSDEKLKKVNINGIYKPSETETWNTEALFEYDKNSNLIKIIVNDKNRPEESTVSEFSSYDNFGNWHNFKLTRKNKVCEEISREITYR